VAAIVKDNCAETQMSVRLERACEFLGIPYRIFEDESHLFEAISRALPDRRYALLTSLETIGRRHPAIADALHSHFLYPTDNLESSSEALQSLLRLRSVKLVSPANKQLDVTVSKNHSSVTGPMHGVKVTLKARPQDYALQATGRGVGETIIQSNENVYFFVNHQHGSPIYVSCCAAIPDLEKPTNGQPFDVKSEFLSIVPLFTYLRWAFHDVCWQPNEHGACFIIDDPLLRTRYGCCDFERLDALMKKHSFTTNIAFIPWNWRRTSARMTELIRNSANRFSISVHGCDHTRQEFGSQNAGVLNSKTDLARRRMESHQARTGLVHDRVMVFPQGAYSTKALRALQQSQFIAAVNTNVLPLGEEPDGLTIKDVCSPAILKYHSFPVFTRRYPEDGLENFAFDLLLGKPCLVVEHHKFFSDNGQQAADFVDKLNSLNCSLRWNSLGNVLKRSFQWQQSSEGNTRIKMIANEMAVANAEQRAVCCNIHKADIDSAGVTGILCDGKPLTWHRDNDSLAFSCSVPAQSQLNITVRYRSIAGNVKSPFNPKAVMKIATRRYLSEFRDNFLCRHQKLMSLAQIARRAAMPSKRIAPADAQNGPSASRHVR
jgi:hypothetical protein